MSHVKELSASAIVQVAENNRRARGADPCEFVHPRLMRAIEASGLIKRLYGEQRT